MTREEAIKVVKRTKGAMVYTEKEKEALETLIPELAESDDERIIRAIIDALYSHTNSINLLSSRGYQMEDIEAWLEKQKEHHFTKRNALFDKCVENCDPIVMKKVSDEVDEMLEKEQKPAEWSEDIIRRAVKEVGLTQYQIDWLKTNVFSPKQEWNENYREEDIQTRFAFYTYKDDPSVLYLSNVFVEETSRNHGFGTRILRAAEKVAETIGAITIRLKVKQDSPVNLWYRKNGYGYVTFEDGYDWMEKNLEYLKPVKSAEWSEEDDMLMDELESYILYDKEFNDEQKSWRIKRLKSLRPQSKDEIYKEKDEAFKLGKHQLAIKFMNYLDENRPEGKMGLSNDECEDIDKAFKENDWTKIMQYVEKYSFQPKQEWSEEDEKKLERVDDLLWMLDDYLGNDCSICEEKTARLRDEIHNELFPWLEFLRPQYHGDVTMTEAYKMGLEAGKASSWKPSEEQTNNVIVELTRIELGDIINGLYYLKEKYYEDCKEHNGTATVGLSDEFKFYFKRFNEALDLYTRLHELEKERYGTTTDGYYYE